MKQPSWGSLADRYIKSTDQRKLLALDGGGIRGLISLEILLVNISHLGKFV